jgi:hypothetical protein
MPNAQTHDDPKSDACSAWRQAGALERTASYNRGDDLNRLSLAELLAEPITQALMRADNVSLNDLAALCDRLRRRLLSS